MNYSTATEELTSGRPVRRKIWPKADFIFYHRPCTIDVSRLNESYIPPGIIDVIKKSLGNGENTIQSHGFVTEMKDGKLVSGWVPHSTDLFSNDWEIFTPVP